MGRRLEADGRAIMSKEFKLWDPEKALGGNKASLFTRILNGNVGF